MKVKVIKEGGYINNRRAKVGDILDIDKKLFSKKWMERCIDDVPVEEKKQEITNDAKKENDGKVEEVSGDPKKEVI